MYVTQKLRARSLEYEHVERRGIRSMHTTNPPVLLHGYSNQTSSNLTWL